MCNRSINKSIHGRDYQLSCARVLFLVGMLVLLLDVCFIINIAS